VPICPTHCPAQGWRVFLYGGMTRLEPRTVSERPSVKELHRLFSYDPETGILRWAVVDSPKSTSIHVGSIAGSSHRNGRTFYRHVIIDHVSYMVHRIIWAMCYGEWPERDIDHEDHDGLNNRIGNLRLATPPQNQGNQRPKTFGGTSSPFRGVSWHSMEKKWGA